MATVSPAPSMAHQAQAESDAAARRADGGSQDMPHSRPASGASRAPPSPAHSAVVVTASQELAASGARSEADKPYVLQTNAPVRMSFTAFTKESYAKLVRRERALKERMDRKRENEEGRLVNGEIVFDDEEDEDFLKTDFNPKLIDGQPLPDKFGRFPRDLYGKPIEEVDHYIKYKTFVVITKSAGRNKISRYSASNSLFCFAPWNPFRKLIIRLTSNQYFDYAILLVIVLSCITMALDPSVYTPISPPFEYSFVVIYTLEFLFRAVSRGFILNKHAYLRDPWSYIDFIVILISYLTYVLQAVGNIDVSYFKVLRALRVLRTVKGISIVPGLRMIVNTVLNSFRQLAEAFGLAFFIMIIFTLIGMQLYSGALNQKCVDMTGFTQINQSLLDIEYYLHVNNASNWILSKYNDDWDYLMCGNESYAFNCSDAQNGSVCLSVGENPNWNNTHFDNFPIALLNVFQIFTMDHWEDIFNKLVRVKGSFVIFYMLLLIFFGAFYVVNLILAVVRNSYGAEASEEARIVAEEEAEEAARAKRNENTALLFDPRKLRERLNSQQQSATDAASAVNLPVAESGNADKPAPTNSAPPQIVINDGSPQPPEGDDQTATAPDKQSKFDAASSKSVNHLSVEGDRDHLRASTTLSHYSGTEDVDVEMIAEDISALDQRHKRYLLQKFATLWLNKIKTEDDQLIDRNCLCCGKAGCLGYHDWIRIQNMVYKVATDGLFELFITLCIVANTIVMATENSEMTEYHRTANELANQVFTWVFTMEAILKIISLSKEYFKVPWNLLDLVVVIFSLLDFTFAYAPINRSNKKSMKTVLKTMKIARLLRILKLAQSWSTLRSLIETIFGTIGALANVALVLFIMLFLFAVLGNQVLGPGYANLDYEASGANTTYVWDYLGVSPRWNLTDFVHSLLLVIHIICMSWIEMCWDCMNANPGPQCPIIFIMALVVGQFLMLNLFLASLLDSFSGDNLNKKKEVKQESKLKKSLMRIKHCFKKTSGASSKRSITPASFFSDQHSIATSKMTMRRPSLIKVDGTHAVNGSHLSMKSGLSHLPLDASLSIPAKSQASLNSTSALARGLSRPELTPLGLTTDLITDGKENAADAVTNRVSNGVLHKTDPEISAMNLQNIEQAFQTHRDHYARFESAVMASQLGTSPMPRGPVIIAEDFSDNPDVRKTIFLHGGADTLDMDAKESSSEDEDANLEQEAEEQVEEVDDRVRKMKEIEEKAKEAEQGDVQKSSDGEIIVPNCCFAACYTRCSCCDTVCTPTWTNFRRVCVKICTNSIFDGFILVIIVLSSLTLTLEDVYLEQRELLGEILDITNYVFTAIFVIEMILKMFGLGVQKYLTSGWSLLDGAIVTISVVDIITSNIPGMTRLAALKALRTFRALRPLRAVSRWEGMKIVVNSLLFAAPAIFNVLLVCMMFGLIFSILGVQLFAGKYYACYDPSGGYPAMPIVNGRYWLPSYGVSGGYYTNVTDIFSCLEQNYTWRNRLVNFDNVINGYIALYQLASFEGWMEIMQSSVDSREEVGLQPLYENNMSYYAFIMLFIFIGSFFSLNLFIGVIIDNFNMLKKQYDGSYLSSLLTESQRGYYNTLKQLTSRKPQKTIRRPKARFLIFFFDIANSKTFDIVSMIVIFLNLIVMCLDDPNNTVTTTLVASRLNTTFTFFFLVEAIIKLLGFRAHYFRRSWNNFDLIIVAVSTTFEVLQFMGQNVNLAISPTMLRIIRVFRIGRILRLIKPMRGVRKLLFTLISALPGLFNIAVLLFLFMFIFSIICMSLFKRIEINQPVFAALTSTVNFQTWFNSFSLLFRLITVAGWNDICNALMAAPPYCNPNQYVLPNGTAVPDSAGTCGTFVGPPIVLMLFLFMTNIIIVNMYIAVILESYDNANEQEQVGIVDDDIEMFYNFWEVYDPLATQYIPLSQASQMIDSLEPPLRVPKPNGMALVAFNLPIAEGERLHCLDLLMALVKRALHNIEENDPNMTPEQKEANDKLKQQIAVKYKAAFPQRLTTRVVSTTMQRKKEDVAAKTLQRAWRRHKMQKNILRIKELALVQTQKEAAEDDARSLKRKLSNVIDSARTQIGGAIGRLSRGGSVRSVRSIDSNALHGAEIAAEP